MLEKITSSNSVLIRKHILQPGEDYQKVIEKYKKNGWKFKEIYTPPGTRNFNILVFEKEIK